MRRRHRKNITVNRVIIMISMFILFVGLTAGYGAFQTNLILKAKGNIRQKIITVNEIIKNTVTAGDGLYKDTLMENRYIYRGTNPNNYIKIGNDMYRIMSIENDNTLKIIKDESLVLTTFDGNTYRYESGTYCTGTYQNEYSGCNVWGDINTVLDKNNNNITNWPNYYGSTDYYKLPSKEAEINTYLNNTWYDNLSDDIKNIIVNHSFNIGGVDQWASDTSMKIIYEEESMYKWYGHIGLINVYDYMNSSLNDSCRTSLLSNWEGNCSNLETCTCSTNNYIGVAQRTITPVRNSVAARTVVATIHDNGSFATITADGSRNNVYKSYKPVFYMSSNVNFKGVGSYKKPYVLV